MIRYRTLLAILLLMLATLVQAEEPVPGSWPGNRKGVEFPLERYVLQVPENRKQPGSRTLSLPVLKILSSSLQPEEPVFILHGGPGASNFNPHRVTYWMEAILKQRPIVLVGYRGVDGPATLDCPEMAKALRVGTGNLLGGETRRLLYEAMVKDVARLQEQGCDLKGYTVPEVLEDIEAARKFLGFERIHLISFSYGTRLALLYAQLHPEHVKRSILIGVNPPEGFRPNPSNVDDVLQAYGGLWASDPERVKRCPDLAAAVQRVNRDMPRRWLGIPIDPGKVQVAANAMLQNASGSALILDAYVAGANGDASGLALLSLSMSLGLRMDLSKKLTLGDFYCKGGLDFDPGKDPLEGTDGPGQILGSPILGLFLGPLSGRTNPWPQVVIPESYRHLQPTDVETLMVSGGLDVATPARYATAEVLPLLRRGHQVILKNFAHQDGPWLQPLAFRRMVLAYLATGQVEDTFEPQPVTFRPKWSLTTLAKLGLGGALILGALLLLVLL